MLSHLRDGGGVGDSLAVEGNGDLGVVCGGEADESAVVGPGLEGLGGAGLGTDPDIGGEGVGRILEAVEDLTGGTAVGVDNPLHTLHIGDIGIVTDVKGGNHLGLVLPDQGPVVGGDHTV